MACQPTLASSFGLCFRQGQHRWIAFVWALPKGQWKLGAWGKRETQEHVPKRGSSVFFPCGFLVENYMLRDIDLGGWSDGFTGMGATHDQLHHRYNAGSNNHNPSNPAAPNETFHNAITAKTRSPTVAEALFAPLFPSILRDSHVHSHSLETTPNSLKEKKDKTR